MERIEKLMEFLKDTPGDSFLQHALALEYVKIGKDDDARKLFYDILANEPGYVGTYYHLAKLLERAGETGEAVEVYNSGMKEAKKAGDNHAYNELQGALEEMED